MNSLGKYRKTDGLKKNPFNVKENVFRNNRIICLVHPDGLHFYLRSHEGDEDKKVCEIRFELSAV